MILNVTKANYLEGYKVSLTFSDGVTKSIDLKSTIFNDRRKIFEPLRNMDYFKQFKIKYNTIVWNNEADFAPEYLYKLDDK